VTVNVILLLYLHENLIHSVIDSLLCMYVSLNALILVMLLIVIVEMLFIYRGSWYCGVGDVVIMS
jgi:hypothetical protein